MSWDSIIVFLILSAVTIGVWRFIAHIDTYFYWKRKGLKEEYRADFTFWKYASEHIKKRFTGN